MDDYLKFKKLLAWFVNQLNIHNGVIKGDAVKGYGYKENSAIRKHYADCRNYADFNLDCTINHAFSNYAARSSYINLEGTGLNIISEFDNNSKAVKSLYIINREPDKPIEIKSEPVSVASLGLNDDEPNQVLRDFYDMYKQRILEYKSNLVVTVADKKEQRVPIKKNMEEVFINWFSTQRKADGKPYADKYKNQIKNSLRYDCKKLKDLDLQEYNLFLQTDAEVFAELKSKIINSSFYESVDAQAGNGAFSRSLYFYEKFLSEHTGNSVTVISLKEFAIKVLEDTQKPMTDIEIWEYGVGKGWDEQLSSVGKTPWQSIYAILSNYKDGSPNPEKRIKIIDSEQRRKFVINNDKDDFYYDVGITKQLWLEMIDSSIINQTDIELLRKWLYFEGQATCTEIGKKYNAHPTAYIMPVVSMARRIHGYTDCITRLDEKGDIAWWNIPFIGKYINSGEHFEWTIRPEFLEALTERRVAPLEPFTLIAYTKADFLSEVYFDNDKYEDIVALLNRKKNVILQGAPGVGKSYIAKRLACSVLGAKDEHKIEMIQFHQNYSYEDFIEGFRPNDNGKFVIKKGVFHDFCMEKAKNDEEKYIACINSEDEEKRKEADKYKYFFIIDEINRGNLSKVMGELMLLLENDKRGEEFAMKLTYSSEPFYVPENVYVIGMMNTADRSLAMMDYALRRRFSFVPIEPVFDNPQFVADFKNNYHDAETIIRKLKELNKFISANLDSGHQIGHSYFCSDKPLSQKDIDGIIRYEIIELLNEYFFDDEDALNKARSILQ